MPASVPETVDEYIKGFPSDVQVRLREMRAAIRKAAPKATETISYRIPAYMLDGQLVYFAGFKGHVGLYPLSAAIKRELGDALAPYLGAGTKATARFPLDRPIPRVLVTRIVHLRARENGERRARRESAKRR